MKKTTGLVIFFFVFGFLSLLQAAEIHQAAEDYAGKGETGLVIQYYERSLELNPDNVNAKDKLKNLKEGQGKK